MATLRKRGKVYYVRYRDAHGKQIETKAGPDKSMAQRIANSLESQVRAIKTGTADPREAAWADAERKPLTDHAQNWHAVLIARGNTSDYADLCRDRVLRLIGMTRVQRISQINLSSIQIALPELKSIPGRSGNEGLSDSSVKHHARALKMFSRWLWRDGRSREDALCHLTIGRDNTKRTRNALEPEDAAGVIASTRTDVTRCGMAGEDRSMLYAIALGTGFRAKECLSLTPERFNLDCASTHDHLSGGLHEEP